MTEDPYQSDEWREFAQNALDELIPKLDASAMSISLMPGKVEDHTDIKYCLELGATIMLDKPLLVVAEPGSQVPKKLQAIADEVVFVSLDGGSDALRQAIGGALMRMGLN